ncbi:MAG TPA: NAD(P)-dependent oxidoreductase [Thermoleophilaceae bacterium]|jgi:phosphoglycerate dehydrogenase-like enzyme
MDSMTEAELASFADVVVEREDSPPGPDAMVARLRGCDAVLSLNGYGASDLTPDVLRAAGSVRMICVAHYWGGHFDAIEDETGIPVVEGSNAGTLAVAEWNVAAALMGVRRMHLFDRALKAGSPWGEPRRSAGLLAESTVGVVGLGRTGRYTARCFRALGARVIAHSASVPAEQAEAEGIALVPLDELLASADVVSLHHRVAGGTRGALGAREFGLLRDGCVFVNSARAELYDEAALVRELRTGRFSAYIDVFADEPLPRDHPFRSMDNVVLTPHVAGNNAPMFRRCGREAVATLREFAEGRTPDDRRYAYP